MKQNAPRIFLICYCGYLFLYVSRAALTMAAPELKALGLLTTGQIGLLGSLFSIVYACGRLISGKICDRVVPWKVISLGLLLCGISNLCIGIFPPFGAIAMLWMTNALAQSFLWGSILRILPAVYGEQKAKKRASQMATAVAAGNLAGILLHSGLIKWFGVSWAFLYPGLVTLFLGAGALMILKPVHPPAVEALQRPDSVWKDVQLRKMLLPALIHGIMKDNVSLWMTVYVMDTYAVDLERSTIYILLIPLLGILGRLWAPGLYRLAREREVPLLLGGFAISAAASWLLVMAPSAAWQAIGCLSLVYMAVSVINACFLAFFPLHYASRGQTATVSGVLDFATYLGTGLSAMVFGTLIEEYGYSAMFLTWAGVSLLTMAYLQVKERKNKQPL